MKMRATESPDFVFYELLWAKGDVHVFKFPQGAVRAFMDRVALYTHGSFESRDDKGELVSQRKPGAFSGNRPDLAPGNYRMTALEDDSRSVCARSKAPGEIFQSREILLARGETHRVQKGRTLAVCAGTIVFALRGGEHFLPQQPGAVGVVVAASGDLEVVAQSDAMLMELWR